MDAAYELMKGIIKLGLQPDIEITEARGIRVTISYTQDPNFPDVGSNMIKLERLMQESSGRPIDLRLARESDKNKREQRNILWDKTVSQPTSPKD